MHITCCICAAHRHTAIKLTGGGYACNDCFEHFDLSDFVGDGPTHNTVALTSATETGIDRPRRDWGPWRLDPDTLVLYPTRPYRYEVDLERCTSSAQVLDWICQVAGKDWADDAIVAGLIRALDDMLHPQANLCSSGRHKTVRPAQLKSLLEERGRTP